MFNHWSGKLLVGAILCALVALQSDAALAEDAWAVIDARIAEHPGQSGAYVLERGEEALLARAWLAQNARSSIEVQYFIWSTDNIGILATRGVCCALPSAVSVSGSSSMTC